MGSLWASIATIVMGFCALIGGGFAFMRFFYKRGGDERALVKAVDDNTAAQRELATSLRDFKDFTVAKLHDLAIGQERLVGEVAVMKEQIKKGQ